MLITHEQTQCEYSPVSQLCVMEADTISAAAKYAAIPFNTCCTLHPHLGREMDFTVLGVHFHSLISENL